MFHPRASHSRSSKVSLTRPSIALGAAESDIDKDNRSITTNRAAVFGSGPDGLIRRRRKPASFDWVRIEVHEPRAHGGVLDDHDGDRIASAAAYVSAGSRCCAVVAILRFPSRFGLIPLPKCSVRRVDAGGPKQLPLPRSTRIATVASSMSFGCSATVSVMRKPLLYRPPIIALLRIPIGPVEHAAISAMTSDCVSTWGGNVQPRFVRFGVGGSSVRCPYISAL